MSGTSLDGLDIACCEFSKSADAKWKYKILKTETINYPRALVTKLGSAYTFGGEALSLLDVELGIYFGEQVKKFISKYQLKKINFIASHGHTVFHRPEKMLTLQIGSGAHIAAITKLPVVFDFRRKDIALGGQGAPLVPIGDHLLFDDFDFCINLGGIANVSYLQNDKIIAFDICPVNIVLNNLSSKLGLIYDKDGKMAAKGKLIPELLKQLNRLTYYNKKHPKSLGKEWVDEKFYPLINKFSKQDIRNIMNTVCEHIAIQIQHSLNGSKTNGKRVLLTGGGVFNSYLIKRIKHYCRDYNLEIPSKETINFKEALIFAFLGVLRWENKINCLKSVTGAQEDNVGGNICL